MTRSVRLALVFMTSVVFAACAQSETFDNDAGSGSGGSSATGGNGSGGSGSGGSGSGGQAGSGGSNGSGGATASGGVTGSGGSSSGGTVGSGGMVGSGGSVGTGGQGGRGTGGAAGAGAKGGSTGTGGAAGGVGTGGAAGGGQGGRGTGGAAGGGATGTGGSGGAASYNPCPTSGPCKVLPLGDSITYGLITVAADQASSDPSINGKDSHGGYRVELFKKAVAANQNMTFVGSQMNGPTMASGTTVPFPKSHEGWSGYTISMILAKGMANDKSLGPHIVLLHAGTNDTYGSNPSGAPAALSSAVDSLTTEFPDALIVVAKIIPYPSQVTNVNLINNSIPAMVAAKVAAGKHVVMADLFTGFKTSSMLAGDGVHPNQSGYDWMGDTWYAAISSLLPSN
jgi:GDSL-like Lipase/Acylhydrolase family